MYAIMGITGRVGGAIAAKLLAQGEQIRAIVRNPEKAARSRDRGTETAVADVDDPDALASAFDGTDGVFRKVSDKEGGIPFVDRSGTDQRVGAYHRCTPSGTNTRRPAHRPRIPEGWLVYGLGHTVEAVAVPREKWTAFFVGQGMPEGRTEARAEMVDGFNSGWIHFGVPGTAHVNGTTSLTSVVAKLAEKRYSPLTRSCRGATGASITEGNTDY